MAVIKDIADVVMGQSPSGSEVNSMGLGLPLLNGPTEFTERYPSPVQFTQRARKISETGDILFCVRGSTTGRMNYADQPYAIGRGIAAIRGKNGYPTAYVRAVIEKNLERLLASATGSTFPNVGRELLLNFEVEVNSTDETQIINQYIESTEDKIYLNQQINQTLEAMAQATFKSWFVDFEPTRAKMAALEAGGTEEDATLAAMTAISGKSPEELATLKTTNPEAYAQLHTTASLFPSRFVESELGEIPDGWKPGTVEDVLELAYGKALKKTVRKDGDIPVYGSGGINGSHNEALVSGPGIIIGRKGTVGSIHWENRDFFPIDTVFYVVPKNGFSLSYSYQLLKIQGLENMNTDAAVPGLNRNNVYRLGVVLPSPEVISAFNKAVELLYDKVSILTEETDTLTQLRDSLLPKLLSGEISVDASASQTTEAV